MRRRASVFFLGCLAAAAVAQGAGCSGDDTPATPTDAGTDRGSVGNDSGQTSSCTGAPPVMTVRNAAGDPIAPDWSCYDPGANVVRPFVPLDDAGDDAADGAIDDGGADADDGATTTDGSVEDAGTDAAVGDAGGDAATPDYKLQVIEFVTRDPTDNVTVELFYGASVAKAIPDFTGVTAGGGFLTFPGPKDGSKTISVKATGTGLTPVNFYDTPLYTPPATTVAYTISAGNDALLVSSVLGSEPLAPNKTTLVAATRDCQAREVRGGILELVDDATGQTIANDKTPGGARVRYFNDQGLPDPVCTFTSNATQAVWAILNAPVNMDATKTPVNTHSYSIRFSGRKADTDTAPVVMNKVAIELWPDVGNVHRPYKQTPPQ